MQEQNRPFVESASAQLVAYRLLQAVAAAEGKRLPDMGAGELPDRSWILDTYAECLEAVNKPHVRMEAARR